MTKMRDLVSLFKKEAARRCSEAYLTTPIPKNGTILTAGLIARLEGSDTARRRKKCRHELWLAKRHGLHAS